jgi:hypothetical protein
MIGSSSSSTSSEASIDGQEKLRHGEEGYKHHDEDTDNDSLELQIEQAAEILQSVKIMRLKKEMEKRDRRGGVERPSPISYSKQYASMSHSTPTSTTIPSTINFVDKDAAKKIECSTRSEVENTECGQLEEVLRLCEEQQLIIEQMTQKFDQEKQDWEEMKETLDNQIEKKEQECDLLRNIVEQKTFGALQCRDHGMKKETKTATEQKQNKNVDSVNKPTLTHHSPSTSPNNKSGVIEFQKRMQNLKNLLTDHEQKYEKELMNERAKTKIAMDALESATKRLSSTQKAAMDLQNTIMKLMGSE